MSKSKEMKYRAVCPQCNKGFDTRSEGFRGPTGQIICADCFHKLKYRVYAPEYTEDSKGKLKKINW